MKLENVTAKIRPRARWESIDLGCVIARRSYGTIMLAWLVCVWPLWIAGVIGLGMISDGGAHIWWSYVWVWLTLGVAGRLPLYIMSRELFGEKVTALEAIKRWPKMLFSNVWRGLISRFSLSRGLSMPVSELEGLKGSAYKARVNLLLRNGGEGTTQAVLVSNLMVLVTTLAGWFFIIMVFQFYGENELFENFFEDMGMYGEDLAVGWMFFLFYCLASTLIEPLFVGAGFAMYVNSRTFTEGWDIELSFKRLSERLRGSFKQKGSSLLLLLCGMSFVMTSNVSAEEDTAQGVVERIVSAEEFIIHERQEKEYEDSSSSLSDAGDMGGFLQGFLLIIFWMLVVVVVGLLIWVIVKNRYVLNQTNSLAEERHKPTVKSVMGMDVTPESLPMVLSEVAREAWLSGNHQKAMSLLYRGAISWMVNEGGVPILESDTESDCVKRVEKKGVATGKADFFKDLTSSWVGLAYGEKPPAESKVMAMCDKWPYSMDQNQEKRGGER